MLSAQINDTITKFAEAFNLNDLDRVMTFFSEDAIYEPGDGKSHKGGAQIRAAFAPQFNGVYGVCRHDISQSKSVGPIMAIQKFLIGLVRRSCRFAPGII